MKRGVWHQCGDKSQKLVAEQLEAGVGVGVILSPRDVSANGMADYASQYRDLGAEVLVDPQFYVPDFANKNLDTYGLSKFRTAISTLNNISDADVAALADELRLLNEAVGTSAVIAPAILYEAGRPDIVDVNARLFAAAKQVGDSLAVPTLATVGLGRSATASDATAMAALDVATAFNADGWYYAFEFEEERIPSARETTLRCCTGGLSLALTGRPVLHAYAGPMGLLSFGFGATGAAIGHSQNLWKFTRERWEQSTGGGGGGDAPARFFSSALWGTIIYPDETRQLTPALWERVLTSTSFCGPVSSGLPWPRWDANKHLVCALGQALSEVAALTAPREAAQAAIQVLDAAITLHADIRAAGVSLRDNTDRYQQNWRLALSDLLTLRQSDYDYLELFG